MAKDLTEGAMELVAEMLKFCKENAITAEDFAAAVAIVNKEYKQLTLK